MPSEEHRSSIRAERRLAIEYSSNCLPIRGHVEDLSESGMFIDTDLPLPTGAALDFNLSLPDGESDTPITGTARVAWSGPTGMGVEFSELSDAARERVRFFVAAVHFDQPTDLPSS